MQTERLDPVTDSSWEGRIRQLKGKRIRLSIVCLLPSLFLDAAAQTACLEPSSDLSNALVVNTLLNESLEGRTVVFFVPSLIARPCSLKWVIFVKPVEFFVSVDRISQNVQVAASWQVTLELS